MTPVSQQTDIFEELALPNVRSGNCPVPYIVVRSSIFSATNYTGRHTRPIHAQPTALAAYGKVALIQECGPQLSPEDFDVFCQIILQFIQQPIVCAQGQPDSFTLMLEERPTLKSLGWVPSGYTRDRLQKSLNRLAQVEYVAKDFSEATQSYRFKLIEHSVRSGVKGGKTGYTVTLSKSLIPLYSQGCALIKPSQRNSLVQDSLAQYLHAFYSSHKKPYPLSQTTLRKLCLRTEISDRRWTNQLNQALKTLSSVTGWRCYLNEDTNLVSVSKISDDLVQKFELASKSDRPESSTPAPAKVPDAATLSPETTTAASQANSAYNELQSALSKFMKFRAQFSFATVKDENSVESSVLDFAKIKGERAAIDAIIMAVREEDFDFKFVTREPAPAKTVVPEYDYPPNEVAEEDAWLEELCEI